MIDVSNMLHIILEPEYVAICCGNVYGHFVKYGFQDRRKVLLRILRRFVNIVKLVGK